jgi:hypothetical protein
MITFLMILLISVGCAFALFLAMEAMERAEGWIASFTGEGERWRGLIEQRQYTKYEERRQKFLQQFKSTRLKHQPLASPRPSFGQWGRFREDDYVKADPSLGRSRDQLGLRISENAAIVRSLKAAKRS